MFHFQSKVNLNKAKKKIEKLAFKERIKAKTLFSVLCYWHTVSMAASVVSRLSILRRSLTYILFLWGTLCKLIREWQFVIVFASEFGTKSMSTESTALKPSKTACMYDFLLIPFASFLCVMSSERKQTFYTCKLPM